ncbi:DUF2798 domain-containing protein [Acinetobacter tandoii]|nr:DUF2798 domain-containing protein [Acinetobacter tandoii]
MLKIHVKHMSWLMPLFLSGLMSGSLSCFNLFMNRGLMQGFVEKWLATWAMSWVVAYPLILIFISLVRRLLMLIVHVPEKS